MTSKQAFEYITNFDVENGLVCIKNIKKYQKCCDIVEKAIDILEILKPRIHLKNGKLKGSYFTIDENGDLGISKDDKEIDVVFVEASGFVFSEEEKILREWLKQ